ncbi:MAG: GAF domain-containing sensor histidine kinase [Candidatus Aminicenantes bacterium]|nr:GAF domain-containing sensor histidine kinase [Candidatus Aminicenantes bacterium]
MIETQGLYLGDVERDAPKELVLLSIIAQSYFQPFSLQDNLLVILTALTSGSGVGFNRAMLFLAEGGRLKGEMWLGPATQEEARSIWEILSTPGIGYVEIVEHNRALLSRAGGTLSERIKGLSYPLGEKSLSIPSRAVERREIVHVRDARSEPAVESRFLEVIDVEAFLCIPLVVHDEPLGEIIVDNAFTRAPITEKDIKLASMCGLIAGNYIYTGAIHKKMLEMEKFAAMGEMASYITHQLRNPLVTIGGFADQLLRYEGGEDRRKSRRNLEIIRAETRRLEDIVYKLGHLLKLEQKPPAAFDPGPVLKDALADPAFRAKSKGRRIKIRLTEPMPRVMGYPSQVGEAVRNLLDNALDATPEGATIYVQATNADPRWFIVKIKDTGRGIADKDRERLFLPFFTTKENGVGLGLHFVKRIMESCGGGIEVRSRPGKGTEFRLSFIKEERGTDQ